MNDFDPENLPMFLRKAEKVGGQGMDFFTFAVEVAADEVFVMRSDSQIIYVNDSACERLGYARSELIGKHVWEWDPLFPKEVWPGFFQEFISARHLIFETLHQTKSGETFPVEIHAHCYEEGHETYLLAFVYDLTEKKRIQKEMESYRDTLESQVKQQTEELRRTNENLDQKRREAEAASEAKSQFFIGDEPRT